MSINLIAVLNKKRAIGKDNDLVFQLPADLARFRRLTRGMPVIMGTRTWESIPKHPLPGRLNIVVSRNPHYSADGATMVTTIEKALGLAKDSTDSDIWVIGGGVIYGLALPYAERLYLTIVDDDSEGDTYFPDYSEFTEVIPNEEPSENGVHTENGLTFRYVTLSRPSSSS